MTPDLHSLTHYVYLITDRRKGTPLYVGCSKQPHKRIRDAGHPFLAIGWKRGKLSVDGPYTQAEAFRREAALINHLRPKHNKEHNPEWKRDLRGIPLELWANDIAVWHYGVTRLSIAQLVYTEDRAALDLLWKHAPEMPHDWLVARDDKGQAYIRDERDLSAEERKCLGLRGHVLGAPPGYRREPVAA